MSADGVLGPVELRAAPAHPDLLDTGLRLAGFDEGEHARFLIACRHLLAAADQQPSDPPTVPSALVVPVPEQFLASPLAPEARVDVNARYALAAARTAGALQDEVARVPVSECGEGFESIPARFAEERLTVTLSHLPFSEACGAWAGQPRVFWVRAGVMDRLVRLSRLTASLDLHLHIEDAFRPPGVQEGLYLRRIRWTRDAHPDWTDEEVLAEARSKTASTPRLASHKGGAAVDLRLSRPDGTLLDIGHDYPEGGAVVALDAPFVTQHQWVERHLLLVASHLAGLAMYPAEDWHVNAGDNLAAITDSTAVAAVYGPVRSFDPATGDLIDTYDPSELDLLFPSE
jgi:D-alanyl-D-alanine dipeptidase